MYQELANRDRTKRSNRSFSALDGGYALSGEDEKETRPFLGQATGDKLREKMEAEASLTTQLMPDERAILYSGSRLLMLVVSRSFHGDVNYRFGTATIRLYCLEKQTQRNIPNQSRVV